MDCGTCSSVGIATGYVIDDPMIEFRWGRHFPHLSRTALGPTQPPVQGVPGLSRGKERTERDFDPSFFLVPWSRKSRAISLLTLWAVQPVQSLSACTVQLYLYSPHGPYGLYRASVPVQYSYTSTPPMDRTACTVSVPLQYTYTSTPPMDCTDCTEPQCLYSRAKPLLPLWAVQPVQSLSACTIQLYIYSPYGPYGLYRASVPVQ